MISPTSKAPTIVSNGLGGESAQFTIKATGKAFRILIDQLYERKEGAVVREIMSNAWDSHMAAGTPDARIQVTCPTEMDPIFRVRDFGVGMSHDQVMHQYSRIFESTKESTNDQMGQFGLGSKTPFAYTDSFSVTVWLDGEKRVYVAYITDNDVPVINHISTEPQGDEPQGVEVSVPCRPEDIRTWRKEIAHMVMSSDVLPDVDGMKLPDNMFCHEGDGYRVVKDDYGMGEFGVRQGCVVYPTRNYNSRYVNYGYTLIVDVPIGSVDVTANRESMSLNETTRATVQRRLAEVEQQIADYIIELNNSFPNRLSAFQAFTQHDGWLRASIGRRTVDLVTDNKDDTIKTPAQQLNCYYTKTKVRPQYQFQRTDNIILLVDNGEAMLRRNLRMGAFYEANKHAVVAIVQRHELPRLVRVLGLKPKQVRTLQDIPDVQVTRTFGGNGIPAGKHAAPKAWASGMIWLPKTGAKSISKRIGNAWIGTADDLDTYKWAETLKALGIDRSKVVLLTEKQQETMNAPASASFETVVKAKAKAWAANKKLEARYADNADRRLIDSLGTYWEMQTIIQTAFKCRMDDRLRAAIMPLYNEALETFRPAGKPADFTYIEDQVRDILEIPSVGSLTKDVIVDKVVGAMQPIKPLLSDPNPLETLIKFYVTNN